MLGINDWTPREWFGTKEAKRAVRAANYRKIREQAVFILSKNQFQISNPNLKFSIPEVESNLNPQYQTPIPNPDLNDHNDNQLNLALTMVPKSAFGLLP